MPGSQPPNQRRNGANLRSKPKSYGAAEPTTAPAAEAGAPAE